MKERLFKNWSIMRLIRLVFGLFLLVQAYLLQEWFFVLFGSFFLWQAVFNLGCGSKGCTQRIILKKR